MYQYIIANDPRFSWRSVRAQIMDLQHDISPGARMKTLKKYYFGTAVFCAAFLLETFLPIQIF